MRTLLSVTAFERLGYGGEAVRRSWRKLTNCQCLRQETYGVRSTQYAFAFWLPFTLVSEMECRLPATMLGLQKLPHNHPDNEKRTHARLLTVFNKTVLVVVLGDVFFYNFVEIYCSGEH